MIYICPGCGGKFSSEGSGVVLCPTCGAKSIVEPASTGVEWESRRKGDPIGAFFRTVKSSIVDPVKFFEKVAAGSERLYPWIYAVVISTIVFIIAAAYQAGFQALAVGFNFMGELQRSFVPLAFLSIPISLGAMIGLSFVVIPLFTTFVIFVQSSVYHVCLIVLGEGRGNFWKTYRVVCYSSGPGLFQVIPLLGGAVAPIWQLVLVIIGIKVAHRTGYGRSLLAVFLPTILCCGVILLILIALLGGLFGAAVVRGS